LQFEASQENSFTRPYLGKNPSHKRAGGVVQGVGPEFKPKYHKKKKKGRHSNRCLSIHVHNAIHCSQKVTQLKCPSLEGQIHKIQQSVSGMDFNLKRGGNVSTCTTWINLEDIISIK
jgi:hypothetical protein